jgi:2-oxoglutarate dehydrogenase E1 component
MMKRFRLNSHLFGGNAPYVEGLYEAYLGEPDAVPENWRAYFDALQSVPAIDGSDASDVAHRPVVEDFSRRAKANAFLTEHGAKKVQVSASSERDRRELHTQMARRYGHLRADLDPLKRQRVNGTFARPPIQINGYDNSEPTHLDAIYGGRLAVETAHIDDLALFQSVVDAIEAKEVPLDKPALLGVHRRLVEAEEFERFLARRMPGKKKFGAEGAEALIPLVDRILTQAISAGVEEIVIGTMHRGRLNLMANVLQKDLAAMLAEFKGTHPFAGPSGSCADVPYHLGHETVLAINGKQAHITLLPNPSHLEAVDPVVLGRVRALQDERAGSARKNVLGLILHTDAAVIGQGVVAETLQLAAVDAFSTCGTIHVVVNNQLGFTTEPHESRTSLYCTGAWKAIDSLILHVNGDDPRATVRAADLAVGFRQDHGRDAVIDLTVYRRNGHNELDEPRFTQPLLYQIIDTKSSVRENFEAELISSGLLSISDSEEYSTAYRVRLDAAYKAAERYQPVPDSDPAGARSNPTGHAEIAERSPATTGVLKQQLTDLLEALAEIPEGLSIGKKLSRLVGERAKVESGIPWAVAEALAFATLLLSGVPVRLSGQDIVRGAFSHRHFALTDTTSARRHFTLQSLSADQARFVAVNSPLSEYAALGFEYGYSLHRPDALVIWEAQFGDFANGAQIMIDQFVSAGAAKWRQHSGLVMLLPHGLEGQGPEHSSARIERFLQLAAGDNMVIVNPSTPANYFHVLRQQVLGSARKPLIVIAPKTLLRLPEAVSSLDDFQPGTSFKPLIVTNNVAKPRKVLLCSGKIAYELDRERQQRNLTDVMIVRIERLYPAPEVELAQIFGRCPEAELVWVQEEPENMGAWNWYDRRLEKRASAAGHRSPRVVFCGRPESASPAGSFHASHAVDQAAIVARALA